MTTKYIVNNVSGQTISGNLTIEGNLNVDGTISGNTGGLEGSNYIFVAANGTPQENGNELISAYNTAKTMNPNVENRITVIASPGYYLLSNEDLELDTEYIDLVSLDGNRSIIIDGVGLSSNIYYFSDQPGVLGYSIGNGGNDMYDTGNEIYSDENQVPYSHTQITVDGPLNTSISRIDNFTYTATGNSASDNVYENINGLTSGSGQSASFNIEVSGGVVTSVVLSFPGINYNINDTITILGSDIGGVTPDDDIVITVTSLTGYYDINTSVVFSGSIGSISQITYTATGTSASDNVYGNINGLTSGSGQSASFNIEVSGGEVTSVNINKPGINYNINDTITILGSDIGGVTPDDDIVITVTSLAPNPFGEFGTYFTNMYPGFFFMGAQGAEINEFLIDGGLGADGSGFLNYYTFSQGGYQVYVKRVGGTSDPSVNHIIIVNTSNPNDITQTVSNDTNDDTHQLTGLLAAGVTEIYHMVFAKSNGVTLSTLEVNNIVSQFLTILNSSNSINQLLSNLNSDYSNLTQQIGPVLPAYTISVTANNVFIKGVDVLTKKFTIGDDLPSLKVENCAGGVESFGYNVTASGTFTNCVGGNASFGYGVTASGTFTNCVSGQLSFGYNGTASGTFTNCVGGNASFGYGGTASGTFTNCVSGQLSFGYQGQASGIFIDCFSPNDSFGYNGTASGTFTNCVGGNQSFGSNGTASGTFTDCVGGDYSFGSNGGTASGTFTNCVGGNQSFGKNGTLSGKLYYCRLTLGTFETLSGSGKIRACVDGDDLFIASLDA